MDGIGDYIYIIAIAIAALSSILKKKKPLKTIAQDSDDEDYEDVSQEYFPDDESQEFKPIAEPHTFKPENYSQPQQATTPTQVSFAEMRAQHSTKKISTLNHEIRRKETILEVEELDNNGLNIQFNNAEDAKWAFVYAEIFNKKY